MATILLAWNPGKFNEGELRDELRQIRQEGKESYAWSVGNSRKVKPGDRFFMIRLGKPPRGIVGSGWIISSPYEDRHWDQSRANVGESALFAQVFFEQLGTMPLISWERLHQPPLLGYRWGIQTSGIQLPPMFADALEGEWASIAEEPARLAQEVNDSVQYREGSVRRIVVNAYERSNKARARCIAEHGYRCSACGLSLGELYGSVAEQLIHVHHMWPLAEIGDVHEVDAVHDLRPVCPNCHAVIHLRTPPYSIEEVKQMLSTTGEKFPGVSEIPSGSLSPK